MKKIKLLYCISIIFLITAIILSLILGASKVAFKDLIQVLYGNAKETFKNIFIYVRIPRTCACILSGAALAVSGTVIQAVLSNRLASPGIIGVNAGAGLAVTIFCSIGAISGWAIAGSAFLGALTAVMLVAVSAEKLGASRSTVILGGVAINSIFNAITEAIVNIIPDVASISIDFKLGGFSSVSSDRLIPAGIIIVISCIILLTLHHELDLMNLGEDSAQGLGLSVKTMRTLFLILAALLSGAAVSFSGLLGFVGLIIPNAIRRICGNESKHLLCLSIIIGAAFVTICDTIARTAFTPYEVPVGIFLSILGGPFFIYLLIRQKKGKYNG